jgi:hypothetical protein
VWDNYRNSIASRYPWEDWFDGRTHILSRGEDFACGTISIRNTIRTNAMRHNMFVRTRELPGDRVAVQATARS